MNKIINAKIPIITEDDRKSIDNNLQDIVNDFCKLITKEKDLALLQYVIKKQNQEKEAQKRALNEAIEFCNYLLKNDEIEIDNEKYYKHSCDDIITKAILKRLDKVRGSESE